MDASRYFTKSRIDDPGTQLVVSWIPELSESELDAQLVQLGRTQINTKIREYLPDRLAHSIITRAGVDPATPGHAITRDQRKSLIRELTSCEVHIESDRGFTHAEVTAGGIPIDEVSRKTYESKKCENVWLIGEILDVDGRIGGFNFQWAWATGHIAGREIAKRVHNSDRSL